MSIGERMEWWSRLGLDPAAHPKPVVRRTKLVVLATLVVSGLGVSAFGSALLLGRWLSSAGLGLALAAAVGNLVLLRRRGELAFASVALVVVTCAIAVFASLPAGALARGRVGWLAVAPIVAFLVLDIRSGRATTVIVACLAMALWATEAVGNWQAQAVWVLLDRLAAIAAGGIFGAAFVNLLQLAEVDLEDVRRSLSSEVETRRRAEEAAVAAGHAKTRFLGNMSHEIRTPMVGIMGMTDLLMGTTLTAVQQSYVRTLRQSGDNLLAIINDILDFVKIDARKLELERVPLKLRSVVEDALELLDPLAEQRGIDLVTRFAPDTAEPVLGDPVRIRQILLNLIGNAIKFTHQGHVLVKVETIVRSSPRRGIKFTVQDTGVGIAPGKIDRLFEPFTQADISTSRAYGGTGLGLAISKQLTDLMGGEIGVESTPGDGSTFWFTIPGELAPPLHDAQRADPPLKDKIVLVASEHAFTREAARDLARYLGARRVDSVWTTAEIAGAIRDEVSKPDLVMIDVRMEKLTPQAWAQADDASVVLMVPAGGPVPSALASASDVQITPIPVREKTFLTALGLGEPARDPASPRRTDARILVAEDVEVNRSVIRALAEKLGCQVDLAVDGVEAVELAQQHTYDLVLMDCNMPEMDGYAATRKIRQLGFDETWLPIVALTANIMPGERERCEAAGMNDYLAKPVGQDQLERCFARWIQSDERAHSAAAPPAAPESRAEQAGPPVLPVFDSQGTIARLGGNEELLLDMVQSFQTEARGILEEIRETVGRRDAEELRAGAHKLKGALASIGGEAARDVAANLEALARAGDLAPASDMVVRLVSEMQRLETELDRYVETRSA